MAAQHSLAPNRNFQFVAEVVGLTFYLQLGQLAGDGGRHKVQHKHARNGRPVGEIVSSCNRRDRRARNVEIGNGQHVSGVDHTGRVDPVCSAPVHQLIADSQVQRAQ